MPRIARRGIEDGKRLGRHRWVVERSFGWLVHWGGLLRDRAGRLDVSTGRLAFVAILSGVQALLNPMPIRAA